MGLVRSFWAEPRPAAPPRSAGDWRLFLALVALLALEVALRPGLGVGSPATLLVLAMSSAVLWRRSHPWHAAALPFAAMGTFDAVQVATGTRFLDVHTQAFALILPYALVRWGSGREVVLGLPVVIASACFGMGTEGLVLAEAIAGLTILMAPAVLGAAVRYRSLVRAKELDEARSSERLGLARELHDTVAHHVSAIAVRAQAGLAASGSDPAAAREALRVIGEEASRTLGEMRSMVRVLRGEGAAPLAPIPDATDLARTLGDLDGSPPVEVVLEGDLTAVAPAVSQAVYRIAQEAVTNARRHAVRASAIRVEVEARDDSVALHVRDDGERPSAGPGGFGLVGMAERAQLLGGTLRAGPGPERGWTVTAVLPDPGAAQ